ncbi:MAG: YicC family protein [Clostridiales bacterium]|nr:YicC family protein [Clostridiales bacterium]
MIKSMTGYGKGEYEGSGLKFTVEVKSVNHRYNDVSVRIPRMFNSLEEKVKKLAAEYITRGKVDIYVNYISYEPNVTIELDKNLTKSYIDCFEFIKEEFKIKDEINLSLIAGFPDIIRIEKIEKEEDTIWNILGTALESALESFALMRLREGERLHKDIMKKISSIEEMVKETDMLSLGMAEANRDKFYQRVKDLAKDINLDENRLMTEIIIIADKSSIDEELVRLKSHLKEFKNTINGSISLGKKLDFIIQEMNREVNTIGSKASEFNITNYVINMKTEIEKIREQVQNIE